MLGFSILQAVLLVFFARDLDLTPAMIGVVFTAGSVGGLIGAFVARHFSGYLTGNVLRGLGLLATPLAAIVAPALVIPVLIGSRALNAFGWSVWQVHQETTQQLLTPERLRGRVTGSTLFVVRSADAAGGFAAALASTLGALPTLIIGAAIGCVATCGLVHGRKKSNSRETWDRSTQPTPRCEDVE